MKKSEEGRKDKTLASNVSGGSQKTFIKENMSQIYNVTELNVYHIIEDDQQEGKCCAMDFCLTLLNKKDAKCAYGNIILLQSWEQQ